MFFLTIPLHIGLHSTACIRSILNVTFSNYISACISLIQKLYKWYTSSIRRPLNQDRSLSDLCESAGITEALLAKVRVNGRESHNFILFHHTLFDMILFDLI